MTICQCTINIPLSSCRQRNHIVSLPLSVPPRQWPDPQSTNTIPTFTPHGNMPLRQHGPRVRVCPPTKTLLLPCTGPPRLFPGEYVYPPSPYPRAAHMPLSAPSKQPLTTKSHVVTTHLTFTFTHIHTQLKPLTKAKCHTPTPTPPTTPPVSPLHPALPPPLYHPSTSPPPRPILTPHTHPPP